MTECPDEARPSRRPPLLLSFPLLAILVLLGYESPSLGRNLSVEQRLAAARALDRVAYEHESGVPRAFEEAVLPEQLEQKVHRYLKQSAALETIWRRPITSDALAGELQRIAKSTRMPARLAELFHALGDDPTLVAECLVRPILADRLSRELFDADPSLHAREREEAASLRERIASEPLARLLDDPRRMTVEIVGSKSTNEELEPPPGAGRYGTRHEVSTEELRRMRARFDAIPDGVTEVEEERDRFVVRVLLGKDEKRLRLAVYSVPKRTWKSFWAEIEPGLREDGAGLEAVAPPALPALADSAPGAGAESASCDADDTWDSGNLIPLPDSRSGHTAVWTGSKMIVWGGYGEACTTYALIYDPVLDSWMRSSEVNAPSCRSDHTAIWTGSEMIVWGGLSLDAVLLRDGVRYDPATDVWTPVQGAGAPIARMQHTAVWTGSRMIVWGGFVDFNTQAATRTGGIYDPATNSWTPTSLTGAPLERYQHTAVWAGSTMIVWGGIVSGTFDDHGGRYDPVSNSWSAVATVGRPSARSGHTAVWTGTKMIVWGGSFGGAQFNNGAGYYPSLDQWEAMTSMGAPPPRSGHRAVWTGSRMIVWGGTTSGAGTTDGMGGIYDPALNSWTPTATTGAPTGRGGISMVWTGDRVIVWGGSSTPSTDTGGILDPDLNSWKLIGSASRIPDGGSAIWTGGLAIVWNREAQGVVGYRYDPVTDSWSPTPLFSPAFTPTESVWAGDRAVVWDPALRSGARYDPISNSWQSMSNAGALSRRERESMIWTGTHMIVWGGIDFYVNPSHPIYYNTGARYDPVSDQWTPIATPSLAARAWHSGVWTGSRMIVWGGGASVCPTCTPEIPVQYGDGAAYDPGTDFWTSVSATGAPAARRRHTAVWTGSRMIVWGGEAGATYMNTGGIYDPGSSTWSGTSSAGAPTPRQGHTAVWAGTRMIVWGGTEYSGGTFQDRNTGGRLDPFGAWLPTATLGAPSPRHGHFALWTGSFMWIWGADHGSGGQYAFGHSRDDDGDGWSECGGDCNDDNREAWGIPGEVRSLVFLDGSSLEWLPPAAPGAAVVSYDVLRSAEARDFSAATCLETGDGSDTSASDPALPSTDARFFYLVRARNGCPAEGSLGSGSGGTARNGRVCP